MALYSSFMVISCDFKREKMRSWYGKHFEDMLQNNAPNEGFVVAKNKENNKCARFRNKKWWTYLDMSQPCSSLFNVPWKQLLLSSVLLVAFLYLDALCKWAYVVKLVKIFSYIAFVLSLVFVACVFSSCVVLSSQGTAKKCSKSIDLIDSSLRFSEDFRRQCNQKCDSNPNVHS